MAHLFSYFHKTHGEGFLDRETKIRSQPDGSNEELRCEHGYMVICVSVTLQAAAHLGKDYIENLRSTKNQPLKSLRQLLQVSERG